MSLSPRYPRPRTCVRWGLSECLWLAEWTHDGHQAKVKSKTKKRELTEGGTDESCPQQRRLAWPQHPGAHALPAQGPGVSGSRHLSVPALLPPPGVAVPRRPSLPHPTPGCSDRSSPRHPQTTSQPLGEHTLSWVSPDLHGACRLPEQRPALPVSPPFFE